MKIPKLDKNAWIVIGGAAAAVSAAVLIFRGNGGSSQYDPLYAGIGGTDMQDELNRLNGILDQIAHPTTSPVSVGVSTTDGTMAPADLGDTRSATPIVRPHPVDVHPPDDLPPGPRVLQYVGGPVGGGDTPLLSELAGGVARDFYAQQPKINPGTEIHLATGEIFRVATQTQATVPGQVS